MRCVVVVYKIMPYIRELAPSGRGSDSSPFRERTKSVYENEKDTWITLPKSGLRQSHPCELFAGSGSVRAFLVSLSFLNSADRVML